MNRLPEHRRLIYGRTHGRTWEPSDADPITFYPQTSVHRIAGYLLACGIGASLAALIAYSI